MHRRLRPLIFCGRDTDTSVNAAEKLWFALEDPSRRDLCLDMYRGRLAGTVGARTFGAVLQLTWCRGKTGGLLARRGRIPYSYIAGMFDSVEPEHIMEPEELDRFQSLPDEITAFRGGASITVGKLARGMSWTLNRQWAAWYADVYWDGPPVCVSCSIRKAEILAYYSDEEEIVIRSRARRICSLPVPHPALKPTQHAQLAGQSVVHPGDGPNGAR